MSASASWADIQKLIGVWVGTGVGEFPTLSPFRYRERLEIVERRVHVLTYLQETWRTVEGGDVGSHIETGFLRIGEAGVVEVLNAQDSGRVEVLSGHAEGSGSLVSIDLLSSIETKVSDNPPWSLLAIVRGELYDPLRHDLLHDIKAVTYHTLEVRPDEGWARVLFDI